MYLKNLTVLGFKSFADKTSLNFQPGVTAIVGPNGCGKSNVSDAIRWVLGEQSAKALRGGEMADIIFNGTDGRKPLGMAEVSLTVGGVDGESLKAAGVEVAYNEVTLTRRVFRDGGSEYFINRVPCRLRDVQQLFMGTGVGRTSYSIMAQGNITQILSSRPDDRRLVFEEAAGITKFKAQKKESLRKLESTDQNLLRVGDLIREVKRQIGSLQRQAGKARRYKQFITELQHLETQLARHQFDTLQADISDREAAGAKLKTEIEVCGESVLRGENEIAQLRERIAELSRQVNSSQQRGLELKGQSDQLDHRIQFNEERLRELEGQNARSLGEIAEAEERGAVAEQELTAVTAKLAECAERLDAQRLSMQERRDALQLVEEESRALQDSLRKAQSDAFAAAQQVSRVRNQITSLDLQKQGNTARLEKLDSERIQLAEERARLDVRLQEFSANEEAEKLSVQTWRGTVEERQQRLRELQQQASKISQELDSTLRQQAEKRSRLHVLEQLQSDYEGFSGGALSVLRAASSALGSLADKLRVPDPYVTALEAALGNQLQLVLANEPDAARGIIAELVAGKRGRASIAALSLLPAIEGVAPVSPFEGVVHALSVVEADPSVQPLLQRLLGQTLIAPDLAAATEAFQKQPGLWDFVTSQGDLLSRHGIYTGGVANGSGKAPASILGRKNQIAELHTAVEALQERVGEISRQKGSLQSEQTELLASIQQAQTDLRAQEVAIATRQGELRALQQSHRVLEQKAETVAYEFETLAAREQEGVRQREGLAAQISELEAREGEKQLAVADFTERLEAIRHRRETANTAVTEVKVALASEEQLHQSFQNQRRPLENRIRELAHLAAQRKSEIAGFLARKEQTENDIAASRQKVEFLANEREVAGAQTAEVIRQKEVVEAELSERETELRSQRNRLADLRQRVATIDIELAQKNMAVQNLRERIQQKYQVSLDDVRSECITITIADEGPPRITTLTPEEMAASGAATDWSSVAEQVASLQQKLDEMGPVNLVAIDEYEETEQRHQFLTTQHDDLVKAKEQLLEVINRINAQTKEMFTETFNKIRANFQQMFVEIFGGGKADLIMVNDGDVLESGIDIVARPPGKQLQSITLLSGGEQTMTAVALLFSIYQVKPSPFCVLDELDAPLDESNINRFIRVLQRFLVHSQFVIITHNKRTIAMADVLYGVTMQEHGVSRVVSVKFHKADEEVSNRATTLLVPTPADVQTVNAEEDAKKSTAETIDVTMGK
jgi:chromosome segregation protein